MRELVEKAGLPQPDEVQQRAEHGELVLLWHDPKLAVVVELE